mmetsp:Transcript_22512/g.46699  ORF Transcript_22512/g.46699 Transcript_22512/m.46699 type:complete len:282 (+) Transcript_22512:1-846(+)
MDLNDIHTAQISRFTTFCKGKRDAMLMEQEGQKDDFLSDRLIDDSAIYNSADVRGLLEAYHTQVMGRFRDDLEKTVNLSGVFTAQLLSQAQQHGVSLQVEDISIIEDQSRTAQIGALPAMSAPTLAPKPRTTLSAVEGGGGVSDPAVLQQLQDIKAENQMMRDRNQQLQTEMSAVLRERSMLSSELEQVRGSVQGGGIADAGECARQLAETKALLDQKNFEVDTLKKESAQQLSESTQFRELKSILKKKSAENREMRQQMMAAGIAPPDDGQGIELQADSD